MDTGDEAADGGGDAFRTLRGFGTGGANSESFFYRGELDAVLKGK